MTSVADEELQRRFVAGLAAHPLAVTLLHERSHARTTYLQQLPVELFLHVLRYHLVFVSASSNSDPRKAQTPVLLAVLGHVDAGKSSVEARLLCGSDAYHQTSVDRSALHAAAESLADCVAHVERQRQQAAALQNVSGATNLLLRTPVRVLSIPPSPSFRSYVQDLQRNIEAAEAALIVVSAAMGEFEAGRTLKRLLRRHRC
jgi:hypothetical protein